jgi:hypothetical protein
MSILTAERDLANRINQIMTEARERSAQVIAEAEADSAAMNSAAATNLERANTEATQIMQTA